MAIAALVSTGAEPAMAQDLFPLRVDAEQQALQQAQQRLARNPRDLQAMRDAAQAAMRLGAPDTALVYIMQAERLAPGDPVIRAARASVLVHDGMPREALALFAAAESDGARPEDFAADRGLAYDLLGDMPSAQYYYALAQRVDANPEVTRRYAMSLAIMGDAAAADVMLRPLLSRNDRAAWRMRAFMLAVAGNTEESVAVLYAILPEALAASLSPYMRTMPRLSRGQQAAAAHLGIFPRPDQLPPPGAGNNPRGGPQAGQDLVPRGEKLGGKARRRRPGSATPAPSIDFDQPTKEGESR